MGLVVDYTVAGWYVYDVVVTAGHKCLLLWDSLCPLKQSKHLCLARLLLVQEYVCHCGIFRPFILYTRKVSE